MIYNIDVHRDGKVISLPPCTSFETLVVSPGCPAARLQAPGVYLEILAPPSARATLELPRDGEHIWVTNHRGDTLKHFQWPLADAVTEKEAVAV
jgi:hypothetical protein